MKKNFQYDLSIIIVSYNVKERILICLDKIINISNTEIIIIDNNSKDNTYLILKHEYKNSNLRLYKNNKNIGFGKAVNKAISFVRGEYILLLNPDTVPTVLAIKKLLSFIKKHRNIGLVGGCMLKPGSNDIHGTYVNNPTFFTGLFEFTNLKKIFKDNKYSKEFYYKNIKVDKPFLVYALSGGFLLFKKDTFLKIGGFDNNFFMYLEDIDLGIRARNAGYDNYYLPYAKIIHHSGSSSSSSKYKINVVAWRNSRNYFFKKHYPYFQFLILRLIFFIDDVIVDLKHIICNESLI